MKHLLIADHGRGNGTSFYRGVVPLSYIDGLDIQVVKDGVDWIDIHQAQGVYVQRPFTKGHLSICELTKRCRKPLWIDYDDNFFQCPSYNGAYETYANSKLYIDSALRLADVVTVSTPRLKEELIPKTKCVILLPNAFDDYMYEFQPRDKKNVKNVIHWRGTPTHDGDLLEHREAIVKAHKERLDWAWVFVGHKPHLFDGHISKDRLAYQHWISTPDMYPEFYKMRPNILMVPLKDNAFNRSKSNIAWIEATAAGAVCVASDLPEFRRPGVRTCSFDWMEGLLSVMSMNEKELNDMYQKSLNYIHENLRLSHINKIRYEILKEVMGYS